MSGKWSLTESDDDFVIADDIVDKKRIMIFGYKGEPIQNLYEQVDMYGWYV